MVSVAIPFELLLESGKRWTSGFLLPPSIFAGPRDSMPTPLLVATVSGICGESRGEYEAAWLGENKFSLLVPWSLGQDVGTFRLKAVVKSEVRWLLAVPPLKRSSGRPFSENLWVPPTGPFPPRMVALGEDEEGGVPSRLPKCLNLQVRSSTGTSSWGDLRPIWSALGVPGASVEAGADGSNSWLPWKNRSLLLLLPLNAGSRLREAGTRKRQKQWKVALKRLSSF